jgi:septal ring factor EnvC (AmiA/AmiB activator)
MAISQPSAARTTNAPVPFPKALPGSSSQPLVRNSITSRSSYAASNQYTTIPLFAGCAICLIQRSLPRSRSQMTESRSRLSRSRSRLLRSRSRLSRSRSRLSRSRSRLSRSRSCLAESRKRLSRSRRRLAESRKRLSRPRRRLAEARLLL